MTTHLRVRGAIPGLPAPDWIDQALCAQLVAADELDPDLFFPIGDTGLRKEEVRQARQVCWACPCIRQCLQYALDAEIPDGIFGGLTAEERRKILRGRQKVGAS